MVCLFCQAPRTAPRKRNFWAKNKRWLQTVSLVVEQDGPIPPNPAVVDDQNAGRSLGMRIELRETLGFDALGKSRDLRLEVLRNLSNPWPETTQAPRRKLRHRQLPLPQHGTAPLALPIFRQVMREAQGDPKHIRKVLSYQLLECEYPREILQVFAVAFMRREAAAVLSQLWGPITRALYRSRRNVSDPEVLRILNTIIKRFEYAGMQAHTQLVVTALKFAARSRSLPAMKKYLHMIRERGLQLSTNEFRSVIAKFSIGVNGLGEIRNGRWLRQDLKQVLKGFDGSKHLAAEQQYHLGSFLDRAEWHALHGWLAVLSRCKDVDTLWQEWQIWKQSIARTKPKQLIIPPGRSSRRLTTKARGDGFFIVSMLYADGAEKAWKMLAETDLRIEEFDEVSRDKLLESIEHATVWDDGVRAALIDKYDRDLRRVEQAFGVKWVAGAEDGQGHHELYMDQEEALEKLGEDGWRRKPDYGFPWADSPVLPGHDKAIHDAVEA